MTLGEFAAAVDPRISVEMELRDADNCEICRCYDSSSAIVVYGMCEVIDWWSVKDNGRVIVHIDDTPVMGKLKKEVDNGAYQEV